jgi:NAD(P)-dependent dehydrogenase (short-subunit alcohol dehydrogenase family)
VLIEGRIVFVSSDAHRYSKFKKTVTPEEITDKELFGQPERMNTMGKCLQNKNKNKFNINTQYTIAGHLQRYWTSKLCNVWTAAGLARKYKGKGIRVFSLHPGAIATSSLYVTYCK